MKSELSDDIEIIAFPCNQFGGQEPGEAQDIVSFQKGYGVNFPTMQKVDVNGGGATPVYKFLKDNAKVSSIPWNFSKFLVNADGHVVAYYPPQSQVDDIKKDVKQMI